MQGEGIHPTPYLMPPQTQDKGVHHAQLEEVVHGKYREWGRGGETTDKEAPMGPEPKMRLEGPWGNAIGG